MSLPTPKTRKERYLYAIATGNFDNLPTPITYEEKYLYAIAKSGGGGGGGTTVVANPSGEATDDLSKLQVGNTVYAVNGGGNTFSLNGERLIIS